MDKKKKCHKCKNDKLLDEFVNRYTRYSDGKDPWCKDCKRNSIRILKYGISSEEYDIILKKQNYRCAICERHESELSKVGNRRFFTLCIDHSHKTKKVRGLLCHSCNRSIGLLKEDVTVFKNAILYLEKDYIRNDFLNLIKNKIPL
jgi:hypothetical protein